MNNTRDKNLKYSPTRKMNNQKPETKKRSKVKKRN